MFFLGDIALMMELFGFCVGLVFLHHAKTTGGLVRTAGILLLIGSLVLGACTAMGIYARRSFMEKEIMKQDKIEKRW